MTFEAVMTWAPLVIQMTAGQPKPITPATVLAIIYIESRGDPNAVNKKSMAAGLMQVMPREANPNQFGERPTQEQLLDPETNIRWGIRILGWSLRHDRTLEEALYYYSGGKTWQDESRYYQKYWQPYQKARLRISRLLREMR